jgi:hypothetical protein
MRVFLFVACLLLGSFLTALVDQFFGVHYPSVATGILHKAMYICLGMLMWTIIGKSKN